MIKSLLRNSKEAENKAKNKAKVKVKVYQPAIGLPACGWLVNLWLVYAPHASWRAAGALWFRAGELGKRFRKSALQLSEQIANLRAVKPDKICGVYDLAIWDDSLQLLKTIDNFLQLSAD